MWKSPSDRDRRIALPVDELNIAAVNKRRGGLSLQVLLGADEQVNRDPALKMVLNVLPVLAHPTRTVLRLPLELDRAHEVILILEL